MMMLFLLFLSLASHASSSKEQHIKSIFILAGQSNMAGRGGVVNDTLTGITTWDGVVPPECLPNKSIFRLSANLTWVEAREPLHADIDVEKTNGIGPGLPFASAILANRASSIGAIGLVPCAIGGTNLSQWERGSFLYRQMIGRAKAALLKVNDNGASIRGLLWYQGESDTTSIEDARSYKARLETFFGDLRLDLQFPMLPIIQVAIASGSGPYIETIREAQMGIDLLNVRTVDAKGLTLEPDRLHLTTPSQVRLGEMLANAYFQLIPSTISNNARRNGHPCLIIHFVIGLLWKILTT
ncbi:probable carbohydrate esterase At4g34215 isoform X1 [Rosa rugosa]|uniref:probable carbohydrate esterase At4g34215 isoform X1 n=1 Tax=Rosa rugosa TaxID=74645 RepID=UPI002B407D53|nr:probable carbohydrate esterase At4g34215 isoform X1 [Rosa rugosa]